MTDGRIDGRSRGASRDEHLEIGVGQDAFAAASADWDQLVAGSGAPATLWSAVLTAWLQNLHRQPVLLRLRRGSQTVAGAVFALGGDRFGRRLGKVGVPGEPYALPALDQAAATGLARRLPGALRSTGRPWRLTVTDLLDPDRVVDELASGRRRASASSAPTTPCLDVGPASRPEEVVSRNTRSVVARARRRTAGAGKSLETRWQRSRTGLDSSLHDLLSVHTARNRQLRGASILADPIQRAIFVDTLRAHADSDRLRLLTTRIDGQLAAFAACVRSARRLWVYANYASPEFLEFSPGTVTNVEVIREAQSMPDVDLVDWGSGVQRYKLSGGAVVRSTQTLTLSSSIAIGTARALHRRVRRLSRRSADAGADGPLS